MKWLLTLCLCDAVFRVRAQPYQEHAVAAVLMGEAWSEGVRGMATVADVIRIGPKEKSR